MGVALGIDIGGTKMLAGLVDADGRVLAARRLPTRREHYLEDLLLLSRTLLADAADRGLAAAGIGVGTTGLVDHAGGRLVRSMNLGLVDIPIRSRLEDALGLPAFVDNDLHASTLGELYFGVGRSCADFVLFNAGTGIAAGMVFGGRLLRGASNVSGEICHTSVEQHGPDCDCGLPGCLESMILALRAGGTAPAVVLARASAPPPEQAYGYLALGIIHLINLLNPPAMILAGGMFTAHPEATAWVAQTVRECALPVAVAGLDRICLAAAGADAGLVGAAALVFEGSGPDRERSASHV